MKVVADLHLHSRYSMAVSPQMNLSVMSAVGKQKGIDLLTVSDWTHPLWFQEIKKSLVEDIEGIYKLATPLPSQENTRFLLTTEVACIYTHKGKGRRIHHLLFAPTLEVVEKINKALLDRRFNLTADARPILGISSHDLLELLLGIDERCMLIPAHAWTPWFGIYGQRSGYESLEEAFEELTPHVYGIETGLSSDPEMNWQMEELNSRSILSFSDAHSPAKMGRELTVFDVQELTYENIRQAIMKKNQQNKVLYTIEFYPEEGKYHYSGHRNCQVAMTPEEQAKVQNICPVCGKRLTDGVMRRVQELGEQNISPQVTMKNGIVWYEHPAELHPPFVKLVPLLEVISSAIGSPVASKKTTAIFETLIQKFGSEINVLMNSHLSDMKLYAPEKVVESIEQVRKGQLTITPGYDGFYGKVSIWPHESSSTTQMHLLDA